MLRPSSFSNETIECGVKKAELSNCSIFARASSIVGSQFSFPGPQAACPGDESANVMKPLIIAARKKVRIAGSSTSFDGQQQYRLDAKLKRGPTR